MPIYVQKPWNMWRINSHLCGAVDICALTVVNLCEGHLEHNTW